MPSPISAAGLFLINVLFDLYLLVLMVRLILCLAKANYFNPVTQAIIKITQPIVGPIRRIIPNIRNFETSTLVIILLVEIIKYSLITLIVTGFPASILGLLLLAAADGLKLLLDTFFYAILLQGILSWMHAGYSPISQVLLQITSPIMRPLQRIMPLVGGFDLSPIPALILLQLLTILLIKPLMAVGAGMSFG